MTEPFIDERVALRCERSHKRLAYIDIEQLYFYCRECRIEHKVAKEDLLAIWSQLDIALPENRSVTIPAQDKHPAG